MAHFHKEETEKRYIGNSNFVSLLPVANKRSEVPNIFCSGNITRNNGSLGDFGEAFCFYKSW
jgi:hypothetical protein